MQDRLDEYRIHKVISTDVAKGVQKRGMEEAANRIGTKLKEFSRQGNEQVEKVEMAAITYKE